MQLARLPTGAAFRFVAFVAGATSLCAQHERAHIAELAAWQAQEVGVGVTLRQRWFERLFTGPQSLTVLEIQTGPHVRFDLEAPGRRLRTSTIASAHGALAAINGGFFAIESTGLSIGLLRLDGALVVPADPDQGSVGLAADQRLHVATRPAGDWPEMREALGAGPMLLRNGAIVDHGEQRNARRHPRSAIGTQADGRVLWLAVDGRTTQATGMTFAETATVMQALGCTEALNLDGGGSTTLWVAGRGVCNFPCDNKRYDHAGERAVANALLLHAPAVVLVDDAAADLRGTGWQHHAAAAGVHGRGFASTTATDACAVFRAELPFAGRWRLLLQQPPAAAPVRVEVYGATSPLQSPVGVGAWQRVGEVPAQAGLPTWVTLRATTGELVVDALRFEQIID